MKCEKCGATIENGVQFCSSCGTKIQPEVNDVDGATATFTENEKNTGNETLEKIGKFITGVLSIISFIMLIGAFFGVFDKNPIPFLIFIGVVFLFGRLEDKLPKIPTIVFAILEIIALIVCFNIASNIGAVASVKGSSPDGYPNITYEEAFEDFFGNPVWENVGKDEDGNEVVKFTGSCYYLDETAIAEIKFTIYEEQERFVISSVKINGTDMGILGNVLIMDAFEEYEQSR